MKNKILKLSFLAMLAYSGCNSPGLTERQHQEDLKRHERKMYLKAFKKKFDDPKQQDLWDSIDNIHLLLIDNDVALDYKEVINKLTERGFYKTGDDDTIRDRFKIIIDEKYYGSLKEHFPSAKKNTRCFNPNHFYRHLVITDVKHNLYRDEITGNKIQPTIEEIVNEIPFMRPGYYKNSIKERLNKDNVIVIPEKIYQPKGQAVD